MIDRTSDRMGEPTRAVLPRDRRRDAFLRLLQATDRVLWRLEEMNRDGVTAVPATVRAQLREVAGAMPDHVREPLRDNGKVQDTLDSVFEVQERLFRWRYPDWEDWDPDGESLVS